MRLSETLAEARDSGREAVLIFMDLDQFKIINDCHGHLAGSQVLREVGFLIKRVTRQETATVARYGGDEFVAIFPETPLQAGIEWADELRRIIGGNTFLAREWGFNNPALNLEKIITASIGVAEHVPDAKTPLSIEQEKSELLRRADAAMYRAKSLGKNKVVISRTTGDFVVSG